MPISWKIWLLSHEFRITFSVRSILGKTENWGLKVWSIECKYKFTAIHFCWAVAYSGQKPRGVGAPKPYNHKKEIAYSVNWDSQIDVVIYYEGKVNLYSLFKFEFIISMLVIFTKGIHRYLWRFEQNYLLRWGKVETKNFMKFTKKLIN